MSVFSKYIYPFNRKLKAAMYNYEPPTTPVNPVTTPNILNTNKCFYTVGRTIENKTVLRVESDSTVVTLYLGPLAVKQMIRLLESTLDEGYNDLAD
jgi:hypothetical protein